MKIEEIKKYLNDRIVGVIATCKNNTPRASTIHYYPDGWTIYFSTSPDSNKIENIKANPKISMAVDDQFNGRCAFQADGTAEILTDTEREKISKKFEKLDQSSTVVKVTLTKISFIDYANKEGYTRFEV